MYIAAAMEIICLQVNSLCAVIAARYLLQAQRYVEFLLECTGLPGGEV